MLRVKFGLEAFFQDSGRLVPRSCGLPPCQEQVWAGAGSRNGLMTGLSRCSRVHSRCLGLFKEWRID